MATCSLSLGDNLRPRVAPLPLIGKGMQEPCFRKATFNHHFFFLSVCRSSAVAIFQLTACLQAGYCSCLLPAPSSQTFKVFLLPFQPLSTAVDCPQTGQLPPRKPQATVRKKTVVECRDMQEPELAGDVTRLGQGYHRRDQQLSVGTQMAPISPGRLSQGGCWQLTVMKANIYFKRGYMLQGLIQKSYPGRQTFFPSSSPLLFF